jgi:GntR family transcriptional regulator/MocR family aminotransferase
VELARAYRDALKKGAGARLFDYADPHGNERLRLALADLLARVRGMPAPKEAICITRGGQGAIYLSARALLRRGDVVAVEELGYAPAWQALRLAGAELVSIRVDGDGLDVGALEELAARRRLRAVYLTPHHQYPTTAVLSPDRRQRLLGLAARERIIVFEDDYDFDFHYEGRPILPMASADKAGAVVYLGTMSKSLAPGLRLGYVVAPPEVVRRIAAYRSCVDGQGDHVLEGAVATLLEDGVLQRHVRRALRAYRARRDGLCRLLHRHLPALELTPPTGGMAVWARAPGVDVDAWAARALAAGVAFQGARRFAFDGRPRDFVRIGFAACDLNELAEATRRLAATL